jgi:hypothetical protein
MAPETITCPYCNAYVTVPHSQGGNRRVTCPRCGEAFPYPATRAAGLDPGVPPDPAADHVDPGQAVQRRSNRRVAGILIALMAVMALIGLLVSLQTVPTRRARDPKEPLSYLPDDTNVIAAVRLSQALQEPAGQEVLPELQLGPVGMGVATLERWTGLSRDDVSTVVLGLKVDDRLIPRPTLVVQTRQPYDEARLRGALKDREEVERKGRTLYRFSTDQSFLTGTVWYAAETILVIGLRPEDLDAVPEAPYPGIDHLAPPLQEFIRDRIGEDAHAWVIGQAEHWDTTVAWPLVGRLAGADQKVWAGLRNWGLWLHFEQDVALHAAFRLSDEADAPAFQKYLGRQGVAARLGQREWVAWESRMSPEAVRKALARPMAGGLQFPGR